MIRVTVLVCFLAVFFSVSRVEAQQTVVDLDKISQAIQQSIQDKMPGWKVRRGQPIVASENVLIESWSSGDTTIKLSVVPYDSNEEATRRLREFASAAKAGEKLADLGDEGYAWGFRGSSFAFRKANLGVYVSIAAEDMTDKEKVAKQFAKIVADAILPLSLH